MMSPDMLLSGTTDSERTTSGEPMMTTFAVAKQKRATRAKFAKVRTGCVTCKRRHVKCDETKPCCKNCLKWAGYCSGYESPESLQQSGSSRSRAASSSSSASQRARTSPPLHAGQPPPTPSSSHGNSWTDDASSVSSAAFSTMAPSPPEFGGVELVSASYLDNAPPPPPPHHHHHHRPSPPFYPPQRQQAAAMDSTTVVLDDAFWKQTMPHLVRESTAVRYANIAVHTLIFAKGPTIIHSADGHHHQHQHHQQQDYPPPPHQQHRRPTAGPRQQQHSVRTTADHYGRALTCYGHALREARRTTDLHEAILCAVFFVIFETINGDQVAAEAHLQSGQRILDELCSGGGGGGSSDSRTTATATTRPKLRGMLRHVLQFLAVQARDFDRSDDIRHGIPLDEMPCEA
ncbi:DNA replication complex GINS protein PSF2 [Purpureocillium takamizusanense]|uniref:DNA replication complex GINS protein PSF2 n=1 Tax=Purpureocillium takamizusanense TaxID=2060973 RepID=A0A9Q8V616_9HYPO|nr:DNA replication complex GINS protein PSF2 [Purpureocillium takamizusanense]UNI13399.1 DNA replication complex GINS protein PSF2 [Purpureocillium takamizusanense]